MPLCNDVLKILLPCRPALDPPWMLVTKPVAQHRGLAGGVGARGVTGKITPHHQVASEGGLEGGRGVAALKMAVVPVNDFENFTDVRLCMCGFNQYTATMHRSLRCTRPFSQAGDCRSDRDR